MDTQNVTGFDLDGPRFGPAAGGAARQLVVLLHGLGADGNDLIGLAPHLARGLPEAAFVSPDAPFPCDMAPFGRQWFSLQDRSSEAVLAGVRMAAPILDGFLDDELARHGLNDGQLALVGFSQGTMTGLYVGLRRATPCAQIVGFSGAVVGAEDLVSEIRSRPPVLLVHGEADEVVPFPALAAARTALESCQVPVETHGRPGLGHGIDQQGLELAAAVLERAFAG
jgi:phospholipase/carboxylesterase